MTRNPLHPWVNRARGRAAGTLLALLVGYTIARASPPHMLHGVSGSPALWLAAAVAALAGAAAVQRTRAVSAMLFLSATLTATGWYSLRIYTVGNHHIASIVQSLPDGAILTVEGTMLQTPRSGAARAGSLASYRVSGPPSMSGLMRVESIIGERGTQAARGRVWVNIAGATADKPPARAGERCRITGRWATPQAPLNPGAFDRRIRAAESGIAGSLAVSSPSLVLPREPGPGFLAASERVLLRLRLALRERAQGVLAHALRDASDDERGMVESLILGLDEHEDRETRDIFTRLGLAHILAISGFHLTVMVGMSLGALRLTGDRGAMEPIALAVLVSSYMLVLPAESPILRAGIMVLVLLLAEASGRRYDRLTILAWVAVALALWRPSDMFSLGYQLSFGLTAALLALAGPFHDRLFGERIKGITPSGSGALTWITSRCGRLLSSGLLCWAASAPLIAARTGMVSPLAIAAGAIISPVIVLMMWVGYAALLLGMIGVPWLSSIAGDVLSTLAHAGISIARFLDSSPVMSLNIPPLSIAWAVFATVVVMWLIRWAPRDRLAWWASGAAAVWAGIAFAPHLGLTPPWREPVSLRIDMLSVGDGSCHVLRSRGEAVMYDCGSLTSVRGRELPMAMRSLGVWRVRRVVISHPDIDHFGVLPELLRPLGVREVLLGERFLSQAEHDTSGAPAALLKRLRESGIEVRALQAGDRILIGCCEAAVLSPRADADFKSDNDHSLVLRVEAPTRRGPARALLTGDIGPGAIDQLLDTQDVRAHIMELPHHGSVNVEAMRLIEHAEPRIVLQSTGIRRAGDPRWEAYRNGRAWFTTATHGASWAEVTQSGLMRSGSLRGSR